MNGLTRKLKRNKKYMETNEKENMTVQNLWDAAVLRGKYIAVQAYLKKQERPQAHNLNLPLKELENKQQIKPKASRIVEKINIGAKINDIETKNNNKNNNKNKTVKQANKTKRSWFFE